MRRGRPAPRLHRRGAERVVPDDPQCRRVDAMGLIGPLQLGKRGEAVREPESVLGELLVKGTYRSLG